MKCYYCRNEACSKIGESEGNILSGLLGARISELLGLKTWKKSERYVCRKHYEAIQTAKGAGIR
jgi:hypothetical protein